MLGGLLIRAMASMVTLVSNGPGTNLSPFFRSPLGLCTRALLDISDRLPTMPFALYQIVVLIAVSKKSLRPTSHPDIKTKPDANKRVVLECGGIELLLRCANLRLWPDIVTAALWNICAESEAQTVAENVSATEDASLTQERDAITVPNMAALACTQLVLRSTRECDDSDGERVIAAEITDARQRTDIIQELLDLADIVKDETWKEMVSELLEKASWHSGSILLKKWSALS